MKKRFTDCDKWAKQWFRRMPPSHKCAWQYLLDHCDPAGVIRIDEELAEFQIGERIDWDEFIESCGDRIVKLDDGKLWVSGFIQFQYGNRLSRAASPQIPVLKAVEEYQLEERLECQGVTIVDGGDFKNTVRKRMTQKFRDELYLLDSYTCQYCGQCKSPLELRPDHVVPVSKGGQHSFDNIVTACVSCNAKKHDLDVDDFIKRYEITPLERVSKIIRTLKDKDKDKDKDKEKGKVVLWQDVESDDWEIPEHLDTPLVRKELSAFAKMRSRIKKPIRDYSNTSRVFKHFETPDDLLFVLDLCIQNEWQGIKPEYLEKKTSKQKPKYLTKIQQQEANMAAVLERARAADLAQENGEEFSFFRLTSDGSV